MKANVSLIRIPQKDLKPFLFPESHLVIPGSLAAWTGPNKIVISSWAFAETNQIASSGQNWIQNNGIEFIYLLKS